MRAGLTPQWELRDLTKQSLLHLRISSTAPNCLMLQKLCNGTQAAIAGKETVDWHLTVWDRVFAVIAGQAEQRLSSYPVMLQ